MILSENRAAVEEKMLRADRTLDVGGWFAPLNLATHVIDIHSYDSRKVENALFPEQPERFSRDTWTIHDVKQAPWPFPDKHFDFCFCSHLLEDVTDPVTACREMVRVSKAGYIETPSRIREIFTKERLPWLKGLFGRKPRIGDPHHLWLVEVEGDCLRFTPKTDLVFDRRFNLSRTDVGRKLTSKESGVCLWWEETFSFETAPNATAGDLTDFKADAITRLRAAASFEPAARKAIRETRQRALFLTISDKLPRLLAKPRGKPLHTLIGSWEALSGVARELNESGSNEALCRWIIIGQRNRPDDEDPGEKIAVDPVRYRNNLAYRFRTNLTLRQLQTSVAICCTEEPDLIVEYAVLAATPAKKRYALLPRIKEQFREDGAYYLNRFNGAKRQTELIGLLASQG